MKDQADQAERPAIIQASDFQRLLDQLKDKGYKILGPTCRDGAVVLEAISKVEDLPIGWGDEQEAATYRLTRRDDGAFFGATLGPQSWKTFLYPPDQPICVVHRKRDGWTASPIDQNQSRFAFLGVRPCDLQALAALDEILLKGNYADQAYRLRRQKTFILAVNCGTAGGTCFCASMGTGPRARSGFDLALTEVLGEIEHYFVVNVGTESGREVLSQVPHKKAGSEEIEKAKAVTEAATEQMGREVDTTDLKDILFGASEHPCWKDIASRCLTCGNCTMVCPTCFCTTTVDTTDLWGEEAFRRRRWDSCFTMDYSYIHGGSVRYSPAARYRQWLTHKFASWLDQFGTFGCVGCGRCITWCPAAIDVTEEIRAIRESEVSETAKLQ